MTIPTDGRIDLDALAELAKKATPGPWHECGHDRGGCSCGHIWGDNIIVAVSQHADLAPDDPEHQELTTHSRETQRANAAFIAALDPQTVLALIDLARRAAIPSEQGEAVGELPMTPIEDGLPVRDELRGEQTILTYCNTVGTWDLAFFDSSEGEIEEGFRLGVTHWLDITRMWPGITTHPAPAAGVKAPFAVFGQEAIDAAMENERTAQQFRDDLVASPSPPALDGAGGIEAAAKLIEDNEIMDGPDGQFLRPRSDENRAGLAYAAAIRALKETP